MAGQYGWWQECLIEMVENFHSWPVSLLHTYVSILHSINYVITPVM